MAYKKYDSATEVLTELSQLQLAMAVLQNNRTLINRQMNGEPPYSPEEQREQNIKSNYNSLEGSRICSNAVIQLENAMEKGQTYFKVRVDNGPVRLRDPVSQIITKELNRLLKRSRSYRAARQSARKQLVLHGPGPLLWKNRNRPVPSETGIEDVLIPSGTLSSMENLDRFAIYQELTWAQLSEMALAKEADPGWNTDYVKAIINTLYGQGYQPIYQGNRWMFPEKIAEDYKEGSITTTSSSLPKCLCWNFFFRDKDTEKWNRRVALDYATTLAATDSPFKETDSVMRSRDFLYRKDNYAEDWSNVIHWYIGNCSNVAPDRYHSIRSIGYLLYGVCQIQNKLRMKLTDHMFQQLLTWFRNVSDDNREKLGLIDLQNFGVMPDGVSMVTANERHVADWNLIMMGLNQGRQLMSESASAFIPDMAGNPEQSKTMTATESLIRQNTSVTFTSAVIGSIAAQSEFEYREICRRFCIKGNPDPMAVDFREKLREQGIPLDYLDIDAWEVMPEQALGGGNKAMEMTVANALMEKVYPLVGPDSQRQILRRYTLAVTDNADEAMTLIPDAPQTANDDVTYAQMAFSVLMLGVPFAIKEGINPIIFASTLLQLMQTTVQQVAGALQQPTGVPLAADRLAGMANVGQTVQNMLRVIAQDEPQIPIAKQLGKMLEQINAAMQQLAKKLQAMEQAQQPQDGMDAETRASVQAKLIGAQTDAQIKQGNAQLQQQHKDMAWHKENMRKNAMTQADAQRKLMLTQADVAAKDIQSRADLIRQAQEQANEPAETGA